MVNPPEKRTVIQALAEEAKRLELPEQIVRILPPLVVLFASGGLPAAGTAILTALALGEIGRRKMWRFSRAVEVETGVVEGHLRDQILELQEPVEEVGRRVDALHERLDDARVEQLGRLFEEYMRATDGEWLDWLRNAARAAACTASEEETGLVIAGLRSMTPAHIHVLREICGPNKRGPFSDAEVARQQKLRVAPRVRAACLPALLAAGFLEEEILLTARDIPFGRGAPRAPKKELRVTQLGRAALKLLGVPDLLAPDTHAGRDRAGPQDTE